MPDRGAQLDLQEAIVVSRVLRTCIKDMGREEVIVRRKETCLVLQRDVV